MFVIKFARGVFFLGLGMALLCSSMGHGEIVAQEAPIVLQLWHPHTGERRVMLENLLAEFNAEHASEIQVLAQGFENSGLLYDQIVLQLLNGPTLPHVAMIWPYEAALFDLSGRMLDLQPYLADESDWLAGYLPLMRDSGFNPFTSKQLGLADRFFTEILVVNRDALEALGYDDLPHTQDELAEMACAFRDAGGWQKGKFGQAWGLMIPTDAEFLWGMSGVAPFLLEPMPHYAIDTDTISPMLNRLNELVVQGCVMTVASPLEAIDEFAAGQTLFYIGSSSSLTLLQAQIGRHFAVPFEWEVVAFPDTSASWAFGPIVSVFEHDTASNDAAWAFLQWWLSPEINARWSVATGSLPVSHAAGRLMTAEWASFPQWGQAWQVAEEHGVFSMAAVGGYDAVRTEIQFALRRVLTSATQAEQELIELDHRINEILQDFAPVQAD